MAKTDWFNEARFGMFIQWGAYSVAARAEWVANRERIPKDEYIHKYVNNWKAEKYNPDQWAAVAKDAGMKYMVLTTRHHDGFALWDSKTTELSSARSGPKRDLVAPYVEAVRKAGLKVGFYYSPAAWYHPDYPGAFCRDWPINNDWKDDAARQRFLHYCRAQLRELMTNYGQIDMLWFGGAIPVNMRNPEINQEVLAMQPDILINDRNGPPFDFKCSEREVKASKNTPWEACMTLNDNWGYHAGDEQWKSPRQVIRILLNTCKCGGNLLLNVGPKANGTFPKESISILKDVGAWIKRNGEFMPNSGRSPFTWDSTVVPTIRENKVYLHFVNDPCGEFCWTELKTPVKAAYFLADKKPVEFVQGDDRRLYLKNLPTPLPDTPITTIVLECTGKLEAVAPQKNSGFDFLD